MTENREESLIVAFRRLTRQDFSMVATWLADPGVHRWWHQDSGPDDLEQEFGEAIDGEDPLELWVAELDGRPVGLVQCERFRDEPTYVDQLAPVVGGVHPDAASIDYLIGAAADRGRGVGTGMIAAFVDDLFTRAPGVPYVLVPVHADNRASWRTLERAGFGVVARGELDPDNPADSRDHLVLRRDRP